MTFSIVALDPATGDLGVAVASACLAVGAGVTWARAGVGAVATQAATNEGYGPAALDLLAAGVAPAEAGRRVTSADPGAAHRRAGPRRRPGAARPRSRATPPGGTTSARGTCSPGRAPSAPWRGASGPPPATWRRGSWRPWPRGGGGRDRRGRQSAALLVVRAGAGDFGLSDRYVDLRVDDHPQPIAELARVLGVWRAERGLAPLGLRAGSEGA